MPNDRTPQTTNCSIGWFCGENKLNFYFSQQKELTFPLSFEWQHRSRRKCHNGTPCHDRISLHYERIIPIANSQLVQMMCLWQIRSSRFVLVWLIAEHKLRRIYRKCWKCMGFNMNINEFLLYIHIFICSI